MQYRIRFVLASLRYCREVVLARVFRLDLLHGFTLFEDWLVSMARLIISDGVRRHQIGGERERYNGTLSF